MTRQEIFTEIVTKQRLQGKQAKGGGECLYRTDDGLACAVGCLLTDEEAARIMESETTAISAMSAAYIPSRLHEHINFLHSMQLIHDCYDPDDWDEQWREIAELEGLEMPQ